MQIKLKLSVILLTILFAVIPLTVITANAMSFDISIPSFGLYCESQNADIHGKVKYVVDENGKAVRYSEYTINGNNDLNFKIPFISTASELPETVITVNQKAVTSKVCYGNTINLNNDNYDFDNIYSSDIDENLTGTLYTLTTTNQRLTVDFETCDNQNFIYLLPSNRLSQPNENNYTFTYDNAQLDGTYEIYSLNGDFEKFESNADTVKQTLSLKEYIDRNYNQLSEFYSVNGNIKVEFFYSLVNGIIDSNTNCELLDLFINSITKQRLNAYSFSIETNNLPCVIAFSMPVDVQKNTAFQPAIYLTEQTATGNYAVDYTIELNGELPYVIESSAEMKKQSEYIYTAQNVTDDFYFVFSSAVKPESTNSNNKNGTLKIVLIVFLAIAVCALIVLSILIILHNKKSEK